jgi:hypothetical protein
VFLWKSRDGCEQIQIGDCSLRLASRRHRRWSHVVMMVVRWMGVNRVMVVMVMMMRTSNGSLLWRASIGWEAERMEGSRGVRQWLFWQAVMMVVMARGSCQYQHGRLRRVSGKLTDGRGRGDDGDVGQHVPSLVVCCPSD